MRAMLEIRRALRPWLKDLSNGTHLLLGVSGGADSMALAAGLIAECEAQFQANITPVVIDHGLQSGSAATTALVKSRLLAMGYAKVEVVAITVSVRDGMEASARRARFEAFSQLVDRYQPKYFFLGHTRDDQAESVLLGLARGSGTRSLSGMAIQNGVFVRPLLALTRDETVAACAEAQIEVWDDPHNHDPSYSRVRARRHVLPILEAELGPGISAALARSAQILREDADALDAWAETVYSGLDPSDIPVSTLAELPKAVRIRVLRSAIYFLGAPSGTLTAEHLAPVEALITDWKGQGVTSLPGGVKVARISGRLSLLRLLPSSE
ncbi:MAG: tRNA lysidine(34) synthetase TilS [Actinomycetes bacterium]